MLVAALALLLAADPAKPGPADPLEARREVIANELLRVGAELRAS